MSEISAVESRKSRYGRPRKERIAVDTGTPELVAKRAHATAGGDPVLSTSPIGILFARKFVDRDQYEAGQRFVWLRGVALGQRQIGALGGGIIAGERTDDDAVKVWTDRIRELRELLVVAFGGHRRALSSRGLSTLR